MRSCVFRIARERSANGTLCLGFIASLSLEIGQVEVCFGEVRRESKRRFQSGFRAVEAATREVEGAAFDVRFGSRRAHVEALLDLGEGAFERALGARWQVAESHACERLSGGNPYRTLRVLERWQEQRYALRQS
jgi:hypothetical protein